MATSFKSVAFQSFFQDYLMALFVLCLAIIDIVILLLYTVTEAVRGNLGAKLTSNRELPEETIGVSHIMYSVHVCLCMCLCLFYCRLQLRSTGTFSMSVNQRDN